MIHFSKKRPLLGSILLIAGTAIGVGMLALPVVTAPAGFFPSIILYILCWMFMVSTGRFVAEACLWMPKEANLISICQTFLGKSGACVCWALYLFLFYCLMTAHTAAGGAIIEKLAHGKVSYVPAVLIYVACFAPAIYLGTRAADRVNQIFISGVILTFVGFVILSIQHIDLSELVYADSSKLWPAIAVCLTSFGFQNVVPTVVSYLDKNPIAIRRAIWIGTLIPLVLYIFWEFLVLSIVPLEGDNGLIQALHSAQSAAGPLEGALGNTKISSIASLFSLFAMTTSFIGIGISFFDFWSDGLRWPKKGIYKGALTLLVFLLPVIFAISDPTILLKALSLAGGFGSITLVGILPIFIIFSGRYLQKRPVVLSDWISSKISLTLLLSLCLLILAISFYTV